MKENHISWADLLAILDQEMEPERLKKLQEHLTACPECKQKYHEINMVRTAASDSDRKKSSVGEGCVDDEKIAAFLDKRLSEAEVQSLQKHIQECDSCFSRQARAFKSHLHLESHEGKMISTPSWLKDKAISHCSSQATNSKSEFFLRAIGEKILRWLKQGLVSPLPGYAIAGILLIFFLWGGNKNRSAQERLINFPETTGLWIYKEIPVSYRDGNENPDMIMDDKQPLYREPNFSGLVVKEKEDCGLAFSWPKMENTQKYHFTLFFLDNREKQVLLSVDTSENAYDYCYKKFGNLNFDRLYKWEVSGKYGDGLHFKAKGNFTLVKNQIK